MKNKVDEKHYRFIFIFILLIGVPVFLLIGFWSYNDFKKIKMSDIENEKYEFSVENLVAKSAMVTELKSGKVIYKKNEKEILPIASITKLVTILLADEKFKQTNTEYIKIKPEHLTAFGDSGLIDGQVWNIKDLIDFTLISSSNDGAKALAIESVGNEENFILEMNLFSQKIGLLNTFFGNETGLDSDSSKEAGALSTSEDITKILKYIVDNKIELFTNSSKAEEIIMIGDKEYKALNTSSISDSLPGAMISKTGYTDLAGGNLAVVVNFGLNNPVSIVVLGSNSQDRENDILKLYNELSNYYSYNLKK